MAAALSAQSPPCFNVNETVENARTSRMGGSFWGVSLPWWAAAAYGCATKGVVKFVTVAKRQKPPKNRGRRATSWELDHPNALNVSQYLGYQANVGFSSGEHTECRT